jgi:selenide,water dikinase
MNSERLDTAFIASESEESTLKVMMVSLLIFISNPLRPVLLLCITVAVKNKMNKNIQIAAANALSDIYAMGGVPKTAMNLVAFPLKEMDLSVLRRILEGGLEKMREAGVVLVGGHSVEDRELKYGLAVTGFIHPERVLTKRNLTIGDRLILTKPLGTGIINTAIKGGLATGKIIDSVTRLMATLNREVAEIMRDYPIHACTDITGFGLLGHMAEMVSEEIVGLEILADRIPIIPEAFEFAGMGLVPGGAHKNRKFRERIVDFSPSLDGVFRDILFDPQTSGGLLICVAKEAAENLLGQLKEKVSDRAALIGGVVAAPKGRIWVH